MARKRVTYRPSKTASAFGGVVEGVDYGSDVVLSALLPEERAEKFAAHVLDATAGTVEVLETGEQRKDVPWRTQKEEQQLRKVRR